MLPPQSLLAAQPLMIMITVWFLSPEPWLICPTKNAATLPCVCFQKSFCFECGHATATSRGDCLTIAAILNVSTGEYSRHAGGNVILCDQISFAVHIKLAFENSRVRNVADAKEHGAGREIPNLARVHVSQFQGGNLTFGWIVNVFHNCVRQKFDLVVLTSPIQHDL